MLGKWLRQLLAPKIVEVDMARPKLDTDGRAALESLYGHPGMTYLVARLRLVRWYLESNLKTGAFTTTREFDQVQLGIRWVNWLERHIEEVGNPYKRKLDTPDAEDMDVFQKSQAALELVGQSR